MNQTPTPKHTPGKWEYASTDQWEQYFDVFQSSTARTVARTINSMPKDEQEANAALIASAPELLAHMEASIDKDNDWGPMEWEAWNKEAKRIVSKAKGAA